VTPASLRCGSLQRPSARSVPAHNGSKRTIRLPSEQLQSTSDYVDAVLLSCWIITAPTMSEQVLIEVCVDSVASAIAAERGGAQRVELCSDLLEGGVTPSAGLLAVVRSKLSIPVHPIIRPRSSDFCYSEAEFEIMQRDIELARREGADGVVLGILKPDGTVHVERTKELVELARPLPVTFHRAFDMSADLFSALEDICATGARRLLTSGGEQECLLGVTTIARLVRLAGQRITIIAGGRIGINNAATIIERTGVTEIHVSLATPVTSPMLHRNDGVSLGKSASPEYQRTQVLEESVRKLRQAISRPAPMLD
jgi:copper homeostasis protein